MMPAEFEERDGKPVALKLKFGSGELSASLTFDGWAMVATCRDVVRRPVPVPDPYHAARRC
jgi:hypothetical protein